MKKVRFETANSVGHFELPDDAVIIQDNEDDELEDDGMYPVGLDVKGDEDEDDRDVKDDNDNDSPLDRDDDPGMYPSFVK